MSTSASLSSKQYFLTLRNLFIVCVHACVMYMHGHVCDETRVEVRGQQPPSTTWVLGIKVRSSGLVAALLPMKPSCHP